MTATQPEGLDMTNSQWLLDMMGRHDFTIPSVAFDEIINRIELLSASKPAASMDDEQLIALLRQAGFNVGSGAHPDVWANELATEGEYDALNLFHKLLAASPAAPAQSAEPVVSALHSLMGAVNAYEKETGIGGWYAERVQESANRLLKAHGEAARFGLGSENPIATQPSPTAVVLDERSHDK